MPSSLPTTSPSAIAHATRLVAASPQRLGVEHDAGVGQREDGNDGEARDGVQAVLELFEHAATGDRARRGEQRERDAGDRGVNS